MIYFLIYLFAEVMITTEIASRIGGVVTFVEIIGSAVLGIIILLNFRHTLSENMNALRTGQIDTDGFMQRNLMGLVGAILLILPGFLGDMIGIAMLFALVTKLLINRFSRKYVKPNQPKDDYVIDAEIIDDFTAIR